MALIEPNSRIEFLTGIPFDPSYENTMYFDDLTAQNTYFGTKFLVDLSFNIPNIHLSKVRPVTVFPFL